MFLFYPPKNGKREVFSYFGVLWKCSIGLNWDNCPGGNSMFDVRNNNAKTICCVWSKTIQTKVIK